VLKLIEELDRVPPYYSKKMVNTDELWEVRAAVASNIFRLIGFFDGQILLFWYMHSKRKLKKHQNRSSKTAEERRKDYFRRKQK
jgi:hypothetical protein